MVDPAGITEYKVAAENFREPQANSPPIGFRQALAGSAGQTGNLCGVDQWVFEG
jgi:hypothetical protein